MGKNIRRMFLAALALLAFVAMNSCGSSETPMMSQFETTACKHTLEANSTTRCGYLIVPEDRSRPNNGKWLKLYVAIYKSLIGSSINPPLLYLIGGPGASTASAYDAFESTASANYFRQNFGDDRDIIVLDQRGTNYSNPSLYCSRELGPLRSQVYGISFADAAALRINAMAACYSRLQAEGVNLSAYDSLENATDVRDMALILGYEKFNIYGVSYGTRLAMMTMRHYPERIQSVVIDSILPPEVNPYEQEPSAVLYSFRAFFDAAKVKYPNVEAHFYEMMDGVQAAPVAVVGHHYDGSGQPTDNITVTVTGDKFASFLVAQLKQTPYDTTLPKTIETMYATGNYGKVADSWISFLDFFFPDREAGSGAPSVAMYNCVFSAEDAYYTSPLRVEQIIRQTVANPSIASWVDGNFIRMEPAILGVWPVEPLPFRESDPLVSAIPTLMLVGTLDNATPEPFSRPSAAYLSNSFYIPVLAGHATAYLECVTRMINSFVKDPSVSPVNTCATAYQWD
ncbi:MAG: alpha/beta hydrolase [Deltaproteobacteria bacterium]|nr:alpha/beta hydrolase [Deltaproteobacteria bacterium]